MTQAIKETPADGKVPLSTIVNDLKELHKNTTQGVWTKGLSSHHTVVHVKMDFSYNVAEFRHANDAAFCDAAHNYLPALLEELTRLQSVEKALLTP